MKIKHPFISFVLILFTGSFLTVYAQNAEIEKFDEYAVTVAMLLLLFLLQIVFIVCMINKGDNDI